jgi:hypothetical protein
LLSLFCSSRYQQFFVQGKEEKERTRSTWERKKRIKKKQINIFHYGLAVIRPELTEYSAHLSYYTKCAHDRGGVIQTLSSRHLHSTIVSEDSDLYYGNNCGLLSYHNPWWNLVRLFIWFMHPCSYVMDVKPRRQFYFVFINLTAKL